VGVASSNLVTSTKRKQDILKNVLLPFFVYLQDLNLRHEAPNAKHLAETVRGTVSQQMPYISVLGCLFFSSGAALFFGVAVLIAVLGHARYKKAGQF
jgi:hypothetical protein